MKTCMFTGHRPQRLPFRFNENDERCKILKQRLNDLIREMIENGIDVFVTGMAIGVDTYAAEEVLLLKKEFPHISLEAIVPCANQASKWNEKQVSRYNDLLKKCDKVVILQDNYTADCMQKRNRYMVDRSDCVIAVWDGSGSGTGSTVRYALEKKLSVTVIHPSALTVKQISE